MPGPRREPWDRAGQRPSPGRGGRSPRNGGSRPWAHVSYAPDGACRAGRGGSHGSRHGLGIFRPWAGWPALSPRHSDRTSRTDGARGPAPSYRPYRWRGWPACRGKPPPPTAPSRSVPARAPVSPLWFPSSRLGTNDLRSSASGRVRGGSLADPALPSRSWGAREEVVPGCRCRVPGGIPRRHLLRPPEPETWNLEPLWRRCRVAATGLPYPYRHRRSADRIGPIGPMEPADGGRPIGPIGPIGPIVAGAGLPDGARPLHLLHSVARDSRATRPGGAPRDRLRHWRIDTSVADKFFQESLRIAFQSLRSRSSPPRCPRSAPDKGRRRRSPGRLPSIRRLLWFRCRPPAWGPRGPSPKLAGRKPPACRPPGTLSQDRKGPCTEKAPDTFSCRTEKAPAQKRLLTPFLEKAPDTFSLPFLRTPFLPGWRKGS